ncbi:MULTISPECIES: hypothetical protein [Rhodococcus]|uniref:hypothetical protein n=1 Tax=Rhodococcus TaxID=1827 RepID=UPI001E569CA1|nr:hypothetical protein [Rhodococcus pyridinivorans]MCD2115903.1 hypothetical protein [Rhodococcus pyridinivorans]MCZ4624765.1 hypothetical protein [Rhodococcus pyridinivorans]MCZ4645976.1 hypothetical protein [Rhodococcus pyridinivorans]MDJ0484267.1 hypothetical protein [Rhodococcus pyridinivorans]MDV7252069.1 hypothetical protein [Rhodococcus pyridinivorans]
MSRRHRNRMRRISAAAALTVAAGLALPTIAGAEPAPTDPAAPAEAPATSPLVSSLEALRALPGVDPTTLAAAEAIANARGSAADAAEATPLGAYEDGMEFLRRLGVEPFLYPTGAPFCTADGDLPLGTVPAVAGALPGPWPNRSLSPLPGTLNVVSPGETLFAFVPVGLEEDADTSGIQLAWFNVNTFQGGFVPMGTPEETAAGAIPAGLPVQARGIVEQAITTFIADTLPLGGVRVAPVETGSGTVLSAVFGNVRNGDTQCFFLPTIGIVDVPA